MPPKPKPAAVKKTTAELLSRRTCGTCNCFERFQDVKQKPGEDVGGNCLLHPPKVIDVTEDGDVLQALPIMYFRNRCGQHRPQEH